MEARNYIKLWLLALVVGAILLSCRKDFSSISTSQWQPELAAPFVQSDITMRNIVGSDTNLHTTPDSLLVYFYLRDSVFGMTADSVLQPPDKINFEHQYTLGAIKVDQELFDEPLTLEEMLNYIDQDIADSIRKYDGSTQFFPPFEMLDSARQTFQPSADYECLEFSDGSLVMEVTNTMPVTFENIKIRIADIDYAQLLKNFDIASLAPEQTFTDSISLKNLTVGNEFAVDVTYFFTSGSFPEQVLIDLQQGFNFNLVIHSGEVISGKGKIDEQILSSDTLMVQYEPEDDEKLFHVLFREGELDYDVSSGLPMDAFVDIRFPSALLGGEIPEGHFELKSGGSQTESTSVNGLSIDFTTDDAEPYNRFPVEFTIYLPPTDHMVTFDSSDFVATVFEFSKLKFAYADGYFGKREINVSRDTLETDLDFLDNLEGELILTEPEFQVKYSNEIGVPFKFLPEFIGVNLTTGEVQDLNADSVAVNAPDKQGETAYGDIIYNNTNSSIVDFIAIRPDLIVYDGGGITNWNEGEFNFVYDTALFTGNAEVKIPLILKSSFLAFTDTTKISGNETNYHLKEGLMLANVLNGFPLEMQLELKIPDSVTGEILETVVFTPIASAPVDQSGKVTQAVESQVQGEFDENFIQSLKRANHALVYTRSKTYNDGQVPVGFYSDYVMQVAIGFQVSVQP